MVNITDVRSSVEQYFHGRPLVAVFIGGTQGIGHFTVKILAELYSHQDIPLRVYIVGRGQAKADQIIAQCTKICKTGIFTFVQANDLTLITDVDRVSNEILRLEREEHKESHPRIDLLVETQGQVLFGPRQDTSEGLDRSMSLLYYSRIRFILNLMPLLQAAPQAHIVSVYAAGMEATLFKDDISLRQHYSFANCRSHVVHMKTMAFEHLAQQYPSISFVHIYPGLVIGPSFYSEDYPLWFKLLRQIFGSLVRLFLEVTPDDAGYRMLYAATQSFPARISRDGEPKKANGIQSQKGTDDVLGSGAYALGMADDVCKSKRVYEMLGRDRFRQYVWSHTVKAYEEIAGGTKFTG